MPQTERAFVIVNPTSAYGKTKQRWPAIETVLRKQGLDFTFAFTERRGHAGDLAREAFDSGCRILVGVGGEGTLYEMANGLAAENGRLDPSLALGIIPSGTGSDFARFLGIPRDPLAAAVRVAHGKPINLDLCQVECAPFTPAPPPGAHPAIAGSPAVSAAPITRLFLNVGGMGFDGEVVERVESRPKPVGGTLPYLSNLLVSLINYRNKHAVVTYDGHRLEGTFNSVVAANGGYFGGGMLIAPNASATDGLYDLVLLGDFTKAEVVANLPRLYKGTHINHPKVTVLRAREIRVESRERGLIQVDGEVVGLSPAVFRIIPGGVRIIV